MHMTRITSIWKKTSKKLLNIVEIPESEKIGPVPNMTPRDNKPGWEFSVSIILVIGLYVSIYLHLFADMEN